MKFIAAIIISFFVFSATMPMANIAHAKQEKSQKLKVKSASSAAKLVKRKHGGKVLSAKAVNNKTGYNVKLLKKDGNIVHVHVNAKTGKVSN